MVCCIIKTKARVLQSSTRAFAYASWGSSVSAAATSRSVAADWTAVSLMGPAILKIIFSPPAAIVGAVSSCPRLPAARFVVLSHATAADIPAKKEQPHGAPWGCFPFFSQPAFFRASVSALAS